MRHRLRRYMPSADKVREIRVMHIFGDALFHPALWHLNRRSAAGGIAAGLFCGLIPGPLQMLAAGIMAVVFRVNLPLALVTTLYTNPITIVPLYLAAYQIGSWVLSVEGRAPPAPPPAWSMAQPLQSAEAFGQWLLHLGSPLALGVFLLACLLALLGYVLVRVGWNMYLRRAWVARKQARQR